MKELVFVSSVQQELAAERKASQFVVTFWRDWLTGEVMAGLNLNDRQQRAIVAIKTQRQMATMEYQKVTGCPRRTALRDLDDLLAKGLLDRQGAWRSTHYVLARNTPQSRQTRH